ncbi:MAG: EI24 domain-containing protein [Saprospiraceae bacterium]
MKMGFNFRNFVDTIFTFPQAIRFIRTHRLWDGFWKYSWVSTILIVIGVVFSLRFYANFSDWIFDMNWKKPTEIGRHTLDALGGTLFSSGFKYIVFILMEIVIFHSVGRTIEILRKGEKRTPTFKIFLKAQIRMIKISIQSWIYELLALIAISIIVGLLGIEFLKMPILFLVQAYLIGFAMVDNYNERLGMKIKESIRFTADYKGVALAVGLVVYLIMLIPLAGAFLGPLIGGVTATLMMHQLIQPDDNEDYDYKMKNTNEPNEAINETEIKTKE